MTHFKLGQLIGSYPQDRIDYYLEKSYLVLWISEFFYSWSICLSKLAILTFFRRVFQFSSIRWPIIIIMIICVIWITLRTFLTLFRCSPIQYYWDRSLNGRCVIDVAMYYFATDLTHTLLDVIIVTLPIYEILKMQLPLGQKIAVTGLFSCGLLCVSSRPSPSIGSQADTRCSVCIASAFQIVQSTRYDPNSQELPYQLGLSMIWGSVEVQIAVLASEKNVLQGRLRESSADQGTAPLRLSPSSPTNIP